LFAKNYNHFIGLCVCKKALTYDLKDDLGFPDWQEKKRVFETGPGLPDGIFSYQNPNLGIYGRP
jgi:hypothetical protein